MLRSLLCFSNLNISISASMPLTMAQWPQPSARPSSGASPPEPRCTGASAQASLSCISGCCSHPFPFSWLPNRDTWIVLDLLYLLHVSAFCTWECLVIGEHKSWQMTTIIISTPGNVCWISWNEEFLNSQPVGHVIVLASPAPEHVRETVHKLGFQ